MTKVDRNPATASISQGYLSTDCQPKPERQHSALRSANHQSPPLPGLQHIQCRFCDDSNNKRITTGRRNQCLKSREEGNRIKQLPGNRADH